MVKKRKHQQNFSEEYNGTQSLYNTTFRMFIMESKITQHTKNQKNTTHSQWSKIPPEEAKRTYLKITSGKGLKSRIYKEL